MYPLASTFGVLAFILEPPAKRLVFFLEWFDQTILRCKLKHFCQVIQIISYHFAVEELQGMIDRGEVEFRPATLEELEDYYDRLEAEEDQEDDDDETDSVT
jgi:hypothetical protein